MALKDVGVYLSHAFIVGDDLHSDRLECALKPFMETDLAILAVYPQNRYLSAKVKCLRKFLGRILWPQTILGWSMSKHKNTPRLDAICGEIDIRIDRTGQWFHESSPIGRKEIVKLFATVLKKDESGDYWLQTPVEKGRIQVEDAPFIAVLMTVEGKGEAQIIHFETNVGDTMSAGPDNPIRVETNPETQEPAPYVNVRDNLEAKIARPVFYDLVALAVEHEGDLGVWSRDQFFPLGRLDEGL